MLVDARRDFLTRNDRSRFSLRVLIVIPKVRVHDRGPLAEDHFALPITLSCDEPILPQIDVEGRCLMLRR